ncbi:MAG TPA: L,D-transpeptidase [Acidobacteriaceae bacterium]
MRRRTFLWLTTASTLEAAFTLRSLAQASLDASNPSVAIAKLKPGQYLWAPKIAPSGPVLLIVSLPRQLAFVYRNGVLIGVSTVSTGTKDHATPTGVFTVLQKKVKHFSNLYNSAPMPYMQRLTWDGIAMHAGNLPGYPASHGCVRLPSAFAKLLYGTTKLGMTVVITDSDAVPRIAPTPNLLEAKEEIATHQQGTVWQPEKSPTGPVSLILSAADKRLVVLRNGVLIGSTTVEIAGPVTETIAYSLTKIDADGFHWMQLPLPGQSWQGTRMLSAEDRARVRLPQDFRAALDEELSPGVTLVVTADSLKASDMGAPVTVLEADR